MRVTSFQPLETGLLYEYINAIWFLYIYIYTSVISILSVLPKSNWIINCDIYDGGKKMRLLGEKYTVKPVSSTHTLLRQRTFFSGTATFSLLVCNWKTSE